ncbi:MAG TPA: hypothetical protein VJ719_05570 [Chthoniobacterales bacterium]|nr:hypothetical protein [Chthoniobacterales bacterium]
MKTRIFKLCGITVLTVAITALAISSLAAKEKSAAAEKPATVTETGRLVIKRSPTLGTRLIVALKVDDKSASIGYGHTYRTNLSAGRHTLSVIATPKPQNSQPWEMSLDVKPGHTYTFTAQSGKNRQLVLAKG